MADRSGRGASAIRAALRATAVGFSVVLACYNPRVPSGKVQCAITVPQCPDGFSCVDDLCFQDGVGGGAGGVGGAAGNGGSGGGGMTRLLGQTCSPAAADCDPSLVCVNDCETARCYRPCQADADCPESACSSRLSAAGDRLCEIPFTTCDPVGGQMGCTAVAEGCYLLSASAAPGGVDELVCDCPMASGAVGEPCSDSRQCFPGLVCPPQGIGGWGGFCQRVCDPMLGAAACSTGGACRPFGGRWGFCF
jgi:hypothetical protein